MNTKEIPQPDALRVRTALAYAIGAIAAFHLAYSIPHGGFLIAIYLWCLFELTRLRTGRFAFYFGFAIGMLVAGPQLTVFWRIFGPAAITLWAVLGFWIGLFLVLGRFSRIRGGKMAVALLAPFLWTGLEYFRSELYYLRFSWLNAGYVFSDSTTRLPFGLLGGYGIGFVLMGAISLLSLTPLRVRVAASVLGFGVLALLTMANFRQQPLTRPADTLSPSDGERDGVRGHGSTNGLKIAGVQMEFPSESEAIWNLDRLVKEHPDTQLLVLSEYSFDGPVPELIKRWCRTNERYLIVGAKDPASESNFYDTAFVIDPKGEIIFRQGKSVPIQFFKDGLPAKEQKLWESPWGRIGMCVCYDLSYTRVTDPLVRMGANIIIVPTMDVVDWGLHQHELHARVAPVRAAEYGIPIFRLASSGISQAVNSRGEVIASAPMPGDRAIISATLEMNRTGKLPLDRVIAPASTAAAALVILWLVASAIVARIRITKRP